MANLVPFLTLTLIGFGRAFNLDAVTVKIGIVTEGCTGPAPTIDAVADIHHQWVAIGGDPQRSA